MPQPQPPLGGKTLLKDKNAKLSAQVAVQRKELNRLQQKLQELEDKELQWEDTIACLNTVWEELNLSIGFLRASDEPQEISVKPVDEEGQLEELLREENPFLALLLKNYLPDDPKAAAAAKSLAEDLTETEEALRRKMRETLSAATNVLHIVEDLKKNRMNSEMNREGEFKPMALANLLKSENSKLRNTKIQDAVTIQNLKAAVADKEAEMLVMQRKLIQSSENAHDDHTDVLGKIGELQDPEVSRTPSAALLQNVHDKEVHAELDARTKEVEERDKQLALAESGMMKMKRALLSEIDSAKAKVEERQQKMELLTRELDHAETKLREAYRDNDRMRNRLREAERDAERGERLNRKISKMAESMEALEAKVDKVRDERDEAIARLDDLRIRETHASTKEEILKQMKGMEKELKMVKIAMAKHQGAAKALEEANKTNSAAARDISAYQGKFEEMQRQIEASYSIMNTWMEKCRDQLKKNEELRLFFELSQRFGRKELDQESKDVIRSHLKSISCDVESKILDALRQTTPENDSALSLQIASLKSDLAGLKSKEQALLTQITKVQKENTSLREDSDAFWKEMDSVSEAYEASREQNTDLLAVISKRDEDNARLLGEAAEAERAKALMEEQRDDASRKLKIAQDEVSEIERRCKNLDDRLQDMVKEKDAHQSKYRETQSKIGSLSGELREMKSSFDRMKLELDMNRKALSNLEAEKEEHLIALRKEKTRADRAELVISGRKGFKSLADEDEERTALRKMVNCSVCSTRLKDRIITKCNHLFCSSCVEANLSSRHRKCPGCGERFGIGDVKPFYFT